MSSGIKVGDDVKDVYGKIRMRTLKATKYKYAIFKFSDDGKFIEVEEKVEDSRKPEDYNYDEIVSKLPCEPRFVAYDFDHLDKEHNPTSNVIMISWCPENCPIRHKLIQGSTINGLKASLNVQSGTFIEADCLSDITSAAVNDKFKWPTS